MAANSHANVSPFRFERAYNHHCHTSNTPATPPNVHARRELTRAREAKPNARKARVIANGKTRAWRERWVLGLRASPEDFAGKTGRLEGPAVFTVLDCFLLKSQANRKLKRQFHSTFVPLFENAQSLQSA